MGDLSFLHCVVLRSCCHFIIFLIMKAVDPKRYICHCGDKEDIVQTSNYKNKRNLLM